MCEEEEGKTVRNSEKTRGSVQIRTKLPRLTTST